MDFTSFLYFHNQGFEAYYFFLRISIDDNCYRNNDDHTSDRENYLLIPDSYQQREKTINIIDDEKTNNLVKVSSDTC